MHALLRVELTEVKKDEVGVAGFRDLFRNSRKNTQRHFSNRVKQTID